MNAQMHSLRFPFGFTQRITIRVFKITFRHLLESVAGITLLFVYKSAYYTIFICMLTAFFQDNTAGSEQLVHGRRQGMGTNPVITLTGHINYFRQSQVA